MQGAWGTVIGLDPPRPQPGGGLEAASFGAMTTEEGSAGDRGSRGMDRDESKQLPDAH